MLCGILGNIKKRQIYYYGPEGQGFESLTAYQARKHSTFVGCFFVIMDVVRDSNHVCTAQWAVHEPVQKLANPLILFVKQKECKQIPYGVPRQNKLAPFRFRLPAKTVLCSLVLPFKLEAHRLRVCFLTQVFLCWYKSSENTVTNFGMVLFNEWKAYIKQP